MISHGVVPRQFLPRNVFARLFRLNHLFGGGVLRREKEDHDRRDNEQHGHVEPPGTVEVLNIFGLEQVITHAEERELVHECLHNCV